MGIRFNDSISRGIGSFIMRLENFEGILRKVATCPIGEAVISPPYAAYMAYNILKEARSGEGRGKSKKELLSRWWLNEQESKGRAGFLENTSATGQQMP